MGNKVPTLKELIAGCTRKEFKYEELLYKSFYGYIYGVTLRYIKDQDMVMELVNDAFLRIFKNINDFTFDGPSEALHKAFKGWISRITANLAIDRLRSRKTIVYVEEITDKDMMEIAIESPDKLSFKDIMALLDRLPPVQQLIFNMHEIEGFSHEEIALKLRIPASTSRVYLTRARTQLAQRYQKIMGMYYEK
ncbi:sigma-70 family RNA polymerase sigma factor [Pedobacter sp. BS3]|uniref:RNA polymerase sigma factor n=1 Tax=Pedobacter sp. BS3 TaxID=2567937 RepID=UPI0011EBEB64|nr:sigma-70 family RNA polymerase sigma factor [Pedobacter sp. BS3]TZF84737.1 sigma-70 family RNA polymerase sigma factor [Pedobacter sp. BS3]